MKNVDLYVYLMIYKLISWCVILHNSLWQKILDSRAVFEKKQIREAGFLFYLLFPQKQTRVAGFLYFLQKQMSYAFALAVILSDNVPWEVYHGPCLYLIKYKSHAGQ